MAPNESAARQTDIMGAKIITDTARLRTAEETTPAEWWKERHKPGHVTMNKYGTAVLHSRGLVLLKEADEEEKRKRREHRRETEDKTEENRRVRYDRESDERRET